MYDLKFETTKVADFLSRSPLPEETGDKEVSSTYIAFLDTRLFLPNQIEIYANNDEQCQQIMKWKMKDGQILSLKIIKEQN